ncbi:MAG: hypothetical protein INR63_17060 [Actinomycetospora chiangmaiensis]|nr:hypothetical protein [Actinomycetospora chiangmaiensis]
MTRRSGLGFATAMSILFSNPFTPVRAAERGGDVATQRLLDDMTRHDLCARDDRQLRRLNRSLAVGAGRHPDGTRAR